jgi:hypothetical protein
VKLALLILFVPAVALAYPQYQLAKDQTCTGCHVSPAGGGLLNENGLAVAESASTYGGAPEAAHGSLVGPSWLEVGADLRAGAGLIADLGPRPSAFPMQAEAGALVHHAAFSLYATLGVQDGDTSAPIKFLQLREHYATWQSDELYVRVGRFMPVYGLRFAEHNDFTRQYGQTPLYGETYGAAVEYVDSSWEAHFTAFVHDPIQDAVELGNGAAAYAEKRLGGVFSVGAEGRYAKSTDDARTAGGVTAKLWLDPVLFQLEGQLVKQTFAAGGARDQIVSYLMVSWFVHDGWLVDFGLSQFDADTRVPKLDIEAFDANLHWFASSHWELLLTNRVQTADLGSGGHSSGYSLFQFHYRL